MTESKEGAIPLKWIYDQSGRLQGAAEGADPRHLPSRPGQGSGAAGQRADGGQARHHAEGAAGRRAGLDGLRGRSSSPTSSGRDKINNGLFLDAIYECRPRISNGKIQKPADPFPWTGWWKRSTRDEGGIGAAGQGADLAADGVGSRGRCGTRPEGADAAEAAGRHPTESPGWQRRPLPGATRSSRTCRSRR